MFVRMTATCSTYFCAELFCYCNRFSRWLAKHIRHNHRHERRNHRANRMHVHRMCMLRMSQNKRASSSMDCSPITGAYLEENAEVVAFVAQFQQRHRPSAGTLAVVDTIRAICNGWDQVIFTYANIAELYIMKMDIIVTYGAMRLSAAVR